MGEQLDLFYEARRIDLTEEISASIVDDVDTDTLANVVAILEGLLIRTHPSRQVLLREAIGMLREYARADRMRA